MKALLLLSGGFDSPVAGHMMKQKGLDIVALTFSQEPITDDQEVRKSAKLAKHIGCDKHIVIKIGTQLAEIVKQCKHKYYYILQRRLFFRIAEIIAKKEGCEYLITGDNLGQVGSQTLSNMCVIDNATSMTVLRPILCNDKNETIAIARTIGTYETSEGPELCSLLGPKNPVTSSNLRYIEFEEKNLEMDSLIDQAIGTLSETDYE